MRIQDHWACPKPLLILYKITLLPIDPSMTNYIYIWTLQLSCTVLACALSSKKTQVILRIGVQKFVFLVNSLGIRYRNVRYSSVPWINQNIS